jgi:hypothetical protein
VKKLLFTAVLLPFLFSGCQEEPTPVAPDAPGMYFDVPAFLAGQEAQLQAEKPMVKKTVAIRGQKPETQLLTPENWEEELRYFKETDLNKKALQGAYQVSETTDGPYKITRYTLKPETTAPISLLEIKTDAAGNVMQLKALAEQKNVLVYTREWLTFTLNASRKWQSYRISGVQKVLLSDSLQYETLAEAR